MIKAEKRITRSVRLPLDLDKKIRKAAKVSRGTMSQNDVIVRWLKDATDSVMEGNNDRTNR